MDYVFLSHGCICRNFLFVHNYPVLGYNPYAALARPCDFEFPRALEFPGLDVATDDFSDQFAEFLAISRDFFIRDIYGTGECVMDFNFFVGHRNPPCC